MRTGSSRRAIELGFDLASRYSSVPKYRASLARSRFRLAEALRSDGSLSEAESQCRQAVDLEKALASEFANLSGYRFQWVWGLDRLAEIQSAAKKPAAARDSLQEAIATLKSLQDSDRAALGADDAGFAILEPRPRAPPTGRNDPSCRSRRKQRHPVR